VGIFTDVLRLDAMSVAVDDRGKSPVTANGPQI